MTIEYDQRLYLGKEYDLDAREVRDEKVLYDLDDLTTHGVCVGMTGSGKTGLCLSLLEELALQRVPAICIDPKGDIGNLLLTFPELEAESFKPWIDDGAAKREGKSVDEVAASTAELWRNGLAKWDQGPERIAALRERVDLTIYTPGSSAGVGVSVLRSLSCPPEEVLEDRDSLLERTESSVSGILALVGVDADPVQSREHVYLSNVLHHEWGAGRDVGLGDLVRLILTPPFDRVGVLDVESFYGAKQREKLAMKLNGLLASPSFAAWLEGDPLDAQSLLYREDGTPRIAVFSIAHLSDQERMFFVTALLGEVISWMRAQSGSSSLRALLYMDEVFGFLPPVANPPSKRLFLTLLKQARAFGLGTVLATQNPVDVDYKALSNCGTWWLGRLQTERDVDRVIDGLVGAAQESGTTLDAKAVRAQLAAIDKRVFLMRNVHEENLVALHTRWAMSYLAGPLTRSQIKTLMADKRAQAEARNAAAQSSAAPAEPATPEPTPAPAPAEKTIAMSAAEVAAVASASAATQTIAGGAPVQATQGSHESPAQVSRVAADSNTHSATNGRPILPDHIEEELFAAPPEGPFAYRPAILATVDCHYVLARAKVDAWFTRTLIAPLSDASPDAMWKASSYPGSELTFTTSPLKEPADWIDPPSKSLGKRSITSLKAALKRHLHQSAVMTIGQCPSTKIYSEVGETQAAFIERVRDARAEEATEAQEKVRAKYEKKLERARDAVMKAEHRLGREQRQKRQRELDAGISVLGGLFGGGRSRGLGRAARSAGRIASEAGDVREAEARLNEAREDLRLMQEESQRAIEEAGNDQGTRPMIEHVPIAPRKSDFGFTRFSVLWIPVPVS